jgi:hypothetical protein
MAVEPDCRVARHDIERPAAVLLRPLRDGRQEPAANPPAPVAGRYDHPDDGGAELWAPSDVRSRLAAQPRRGPRHCPRERPT